MLFFATSAELRRWFEQHHTDHQELWVEYYKKTSGKRSVNWPESVDEALCFGWIDGLRKGIDHERYAIRFTRRKPGSVWSVVNVKRAQELIDTGRMQPAGLAAFEARDPHKSGVYDMDLKDTRLSEIYENQIKMNPEAWSFYQSQPGWYRTSTAAWVMRARKEETRLKRLKILIDDSFQGKTVLQFTQPQGMKEEQSL